MLITIMITGWANDDHDDHDDDNDDHHHDHREDELTEEQVREEGELVDEYLTNVTWRGEVCHQVQVVTSFGLVGG